MVLISSPLMISIDIEHLFMCLLVICISFLEKNPILPFFFFLSFVFSRAVPSAYGGSQARGLIGAVAAGLHHSHSKAKSEPRL